MAEYLREQTSEIGNPELTTATLEVLGCIGLKQPITQAEIDRFFAADKRGLVVKLRDSCLVEEFAARTAACGLLPRSCSCSALG